MTNSADSDQIERRARELYAKCDPVTAGVLGEIFAMVKGLADERNQGEDTIIELRAEIERLKGNECHATLSANAATMRAVRLQTECDSLRARAAGLDHLLDQRSQQLQRAEHRVAWLERELDAVLRTQK